MPNGGRLTISSSIINNKYLQITISDNGEGIKPESISKIFERGFKDRKGGTGLGLYIVKQTVELHKGTIEVMNNKNNQDGASFYIKLPIANSDPSKIMIVEDNTVLLKYLHRSIKEKYPNITIDVASNEYQAIKLLNENFSEKNNRIYDFIVADIKLDDGGGSDFGGIHLLEYINNNNIVAKVIVITANKGAMYPDQSGQKKGVFEKAIELGAIACLSRNQPQSYLDQLNEILGSEIIIGK
jgi:CheY-like chemotaxis protein